MACDPLSARLFLQILLMDEVDGMAGNEDRGGVAELIQLLKGSRIPVVCMCNDRNHPKIRSLANHCFDLRFHRPKVEQIRVSSELFVLNCKFVAGLKLTFKPNILLKAETNGDQVK